MQEIAARAVQLHQSGKLNQAEKLYREFLARDPNHATALHLLGVCLYQRGRIEEALPFFERSVTLDGLDPGVHINHALALSAAGLHDRARQSSERAVALNPGYAGAQNSLGAAYHRAGDYALAEACFRKAVALKPDYAEALANLGLCEIERGDNDAAIASLEKARALAPAALPTLSGLGSAKALRRDDVGAIAAFAEVVALDPKNGYARAHLHQLKRQIADWRGYAADIRALAGKDALWSRERDLPSPFIVHVAIDQPGLQRDVAEIYARKIARDFEPLAALERTAGRCDPSRRIRIGYLSPDFRQHPVAILMVDLMTSHDRAAFEVFAFSYGGDDGGDLRARIANGVDHFIDIVALSPIAAAGVIRANEIDILIDLAGFTTHSRPAILALRPAPVQAQYLGFLGSMGASFIDYVIADAVAVPTANEPFFAEKIVRLPRSLQAVPNRPSPRPSSTRADHGLPSEGVVFCCFNNTYKYTPEMFDAWMRILKRVDGSVLWLLADSEAAVANLKREATMRGLDAARLVFAERVPYTEHLERHRHADVFLDTLPYNAGTTASDALWAGVPVLTLPGKSFAARMAASLVTAIGMEEMVMPNLAAYEAQAIRIGNDTEERTALRERLAHLLDEGRFFDVDLFRQEIEAAFRTMMARWREGLEPANITIAG